MKSIYERINNLNESSKYDTAALAKNWRKMDAIIVATDGDESNFEFKFYDGKNFTDNFMKAKVMTGEEAYDLTYNSKNPLNDIGAFDIVADPTLWKAWAQWHHENADGEEARTIEELIRRFHIK